MKISSRGGVAFIALICALMLSACGKNGENVFTQTHRPDESISAALDELSRLHSYTDTGLNYQQYSDKLLTAKANIDLALQRTKDDAAAKRINEAFNYYLIARDKWEEKINGEDYMGSVYEEEIRDAWTHADEATNKAIQYASADDTTREKLDNEAADEARQEEAAQKEADSATPSATPEVEQAMATATPDDTPPPVPQSSPVTTVSESQAAAVEKYPDLAIAGSPFNKLFLQKYQALKEEPGALDDPNWPVTLADQCATELQQQGVQGPQTTGS